MSCTIDSSHPINDGPAVNPTEGAPRSQKGHVAGRASCDWSQTTYFERIMAVGCVSTGADRIYDANYFDRG